MNYQLLGRSGLLRYRPVPVIAIIGARELSRLDDNLASLEITFTPEQHRRLDEASAITPGFPHDFLEREMVRTFSFRSFRDRIRA